MSGSVKGWCPGALRPMASGDGLVVRLKLTGGIVGIDVARRIAGWAQRWGNGQIDLSARGNLQLRGVSERDLPDLQAALAADRLLDADPDGEAVRNVLSSPLAGLDPDAIIDVRPFAIALEARLSTDPALHALPAKFGFLLDDGGRFTPRGTEADIRFRAVRTPQGFRFPEGFVVGLGNAEAWYGPLPPERLTQVAASLALAFLRLRAWPGPAIGRMRDLVSRLGAEAIVRQASCALTLHEPAEAPRHPVPFLGVQPLGAAAFLGLALPFGRMECGTLQQLALAAQAEGATELRLTAWRALLVPLASLASARALSVAVAGLRLIQDPADPRRHVAACTGAPACTHATTETRRDAEQLAVRIMRRNGEAIALHVSGCGKGCAHPGSAAVTLTGRDGRYDMILDGRAADIPARRGLTLQAVLAALPAERHSP